MMHDCDYYVMGFEKHLKNVSEGNVNLKAVLRGATCVTGAPVSEAVHCECDLCAVCVDTQRSMWLLSMVTNDDMAREPS